VRLEPGPVDQWSPQRCKCEQLTLDQTEAELGLSEVSHTEHVERDHDDQDRADVSRGVVWLPNGSCVRMEAAPAASVIFDRLLTLVSQKVIKIVAALISVGIAIREPCDIYSCEYQVVWGREVLGPHRGGSGESRRGDSDLEARRNIRRLTHPTDLR